MHVAVSGWLLGQPSGANRRLLALVEHAAPLLRAGERITVLHRPDYVPGELEGIDWQPVPIAAGPTRRRVTDERRALREALAALGADVLDHGLLPTPRVEPPTVLVIHDLRAAEGLSRWPRWLARLAVRRSCARAAAVVVPSAFTAASLRAIAPDCQPVVIRNGASRPEATIAAAPARTANGYLLHVGHLETRKNLELVVRALASLATAERPDLILVGRDAGRGPAIRRLAHELGVAAFVHCRGVVDDAEVARLQAGARAIVVPSTYEGFGLAAIDGLAHGRPTLVADAGALPEVVGDAGVILPPDDAGAWAEAIRATAHDDAARADARRAQAASMPWADAARDTLDLWRAVSARAR